MQNIEIHSSREDAQAGKVAKSGGCACGEVDESTPELDVQTIPHAIRHASIFGALGSLNPGFGLIISATHDPVPLLKQLEERHTGEFTVKYLDQGPERWRLHIVRN